MSVLERQNLEAHVDLCEERYRVLEEKVNRIGDGLDRLSKDVAEMRAESIKQHQSANKMLLATAGTIISGLLGTIVVVLVAFM
jgi:septal ring factor EnvC (AmiA/AmiB activator)